MKRWTCALLVGAALASPAWADEDETPAAPGWWRPYVGVGYTWGGQTLFPAVIVEDGTGKKYEEDVSAGAGLDLRTGLQLRPAGGPLTLKFSVAYHVDGDSARNGWDSFHRIPLEAALGWSFSDRLTMAVGLRHSRKVKMRNHWDAAEYTFSDGTTDKVQLDIDTWYRAKPSVFAEVEWMLTPSLGLQARVVHERLQVTHYRVESKYEYEEADYGRQGQYYRASHFGLMLAYYFR